MIDRETTVTRYSEFLDEITDKVENIMKTLEESDKTVFQPLDALTRYLASVLISIDSKLDEVIDNLGDEQ